MKLLPFLSLVFIAATAAQAAPKSADIPLSPDAMTGEASVIVHECRDIEAKITALIKQASGEKDIRWKVCLDDTAVTARGIAASAESADARMGDLVGAGKQDTAKGQFALLRGLGEAARKTFLEAQGCPRQLTKVSDGATVKKETNLEKTGSCNGDGVNGAMCVGFTDDMVTQRPGGMKGDDPADGAGTDQVGGSYETPGSVGENSGTLEDSFTAISDPPFQPVSAEK